MKRIVAICVVGLGISAGMTSAFAQRTLVLPRVEDFRYLLDMIPPVPPIPPLPALPAFPNMEEFRFEFPQGVGRSTDPETRLQEEVFRALLRNNPDRALEIANERLKSDPKDPVILNNLSSIASSNASQAMPLLVTIAKTSPDNAARREAVSAIARSRNEKEGLSVLEDLYTSNSGNVEVRRIVVSAIGRSSDSRAVSVLANIVKNDSDETIRRAAIQQLGNRKEPDAIKTLEDILKQPAQKRG
jgi:hypothetical protein